MILIHPLSSTLDSLLFENQSSNFWLQTLAAISSTGFLYLLPTSKCFSRCLDLCFFYSNNTNSSFLASITAPSEIALVQLSPLGNHRIRKHPSRKLTSTGALYAPPYTGLCSLRSSIYVIFTAVSPAPNAMSHTLDSQLTNAH